MLAVDDGFGAGGERRAEVLELRVVGGLPGVVDEGGEERDVGGRDGEDGDGHFGGRLGWKGIGRGKTS